MLAPHKPLDRALEQFYVLLFTSWRVLIEQ